MVPTSASIDVVVQIVILVLLVLGLVVLRRRKLAVHGALFAVATILNLGAIIVRMVPAFSNDVQDAAPTLLADNFPLVLAHVTIGLLSEALAVLIILRWAINKFTPKGCYAKGFMGKGIMRLTLGTWFIALGLGLILYTQGLLGQ